MFCEYCGKEIEEGSKYCDSCGNLLMGDEKIDKKDVSAGNHIESQKNIITLQTKRLKRKISLNPIFISAGIIILALGVSYSLLYSNISKSLTESEQLVKAENYTDAIQRLESDGARWEVKTLGIKKQDIVNKIDDAKQLLEDKTEYAQGIEEFNKGNWESAKELLSKVSETSPYYKDTQNKIEESQNNIVKEQIAEAVNKATEETKQVAEESQKQNKELEKKITALQQEQSSNQPSVSTSLLSSDINKIISSVVIVVCSADYSMTYLNQGSGTIWRFSDSPDYFVLTNAHIVSTTDGSSPYCMISFPILPSGAPHYIYRTEFFKMGYTGGVDWALLKLTTPYESQYTLSQIPLLSDYPMCNFSNVSIGDKVTIFGYPAVGGNNITVTEGNISGFSGDDYKVSSGVIDSGNSGGAAILNKTKCSLGIPTWVSIGAASSVGIVQSWRTIYNDLSK